MHAGHAHALAAAVGMHSATHGTAEEQHPGPFAGSSTMSARMHAMQGPCIVRRSMRV